MPRIVIHESHGSPAHSISIYTEGQEEATRRKGPLIKATTPASSKLRSRRAAIPSVRWDDVDSRSPELLIRRRAREEETNLDRRRSKRRPTQRYRSGTAIRQLIREDTDIPIFREIPPPAPIVLPPIKGADRYPPIFESARSEQRASTSIFNSSTDKARPVVHFKGFIQTLEIPESI
jgi:hypothetical protein